MCHRLHLFTTQFTLIHMRRQQSGSQAELAWIRALYWHCSV